MSKFLLILFSFVLLINEVHATESPWASADQVRARILSAEGKAAVEVDLPEGWHSYWRMPGDAGLSPVFEWGKSENLKEVEVYWPYPKRFDEMGVTTFGYEGRVLFPLKVIKETDGTPVKLMLNLDIMVCKDICIPQKLEVVHEVDAAAAPQGAIIAAAARRVPKAGGLFEIDNVVTGPEALVVTATSPKDFKELEIFAYAGDIAFTAKPEITKQDARRVMIKIPKPASADDLQKFLTGKKLTVVMVHDDEAVEKTLDF